MTVQIDKHGVSESTINQIRELHNTVVSSAKMTLDAGAKIGELLARVKTQVGHGAFGRWIKSHCPFTDRTARNYIRLHHHRHLLKSENISVLSYAYQLLAPKTKVVSVGPVEQQLVVEKTTGNDRFIPPVGKMLVGLSDDDLYLIEPHTCYGFYFVTRINMPEGGGGYIDGCVRGIRYTAIEFTLTEVMGVDTSTVVWNTHDVEPTNKSRWLTESDLLSRQTSNVSSDAATVVNAANEKIQRFVEGMA